MYCCSRVTGELRARFVAAPTCLRGGLGPRGVLSRLVNGPGAANYRRRRSCRLPPGRGLKRPACARAGRRTTTTTVRRGDRAEGAIPSRISCK